LLPVALFLAGCRDDTRNAYLYVNDGLYPCTVGSCKLTLYDKLAISVNAERQEVNYLMQGLGQFEKLKNCTVVDTWNFSCTGLVSIDRKFTDTTIFENKTFSGSVLAPAYCSMTKQHIRKKTLEFFENNETWMMIAAFVFFAMFFLSMG